MQNIQKAAGQNIDLITFEAGSSVVFNIEEITRMHNLGYNCYSTSLAGLFKWNNQCFASSLVAKGRRKEKGNIFCVSRWNEPVAALFFDSMSFPMLVKNHFRSTNQPELIHTLNPELLASAYVNIRRFCNPWPTCVKY